MAYDSKTHTIILEKNSESIIPDMLVQHIHVLKTLAAAENTPPRILNDWGIIENWLSCDGRELNQQDMDRISRSAKSYFAVGIAPCLALQPVFDQYSQQAKSEKWEIVPLPSIVRDAFDRMYATDEEISEKKAVEQAVLKKRVEQQRQKTKGICSVNESCLRCNKSVAFEVTDNDSICPECGWSKSAAQQYYNKYYVDGVRYPNKLRHLKSWKGRMAYSVSIVTLFLFFVFIVSEGNIDKPLEFIFAIVFLTSIVFVSLGLLHCGIRHGIPSWSKSLLFRQYCFGAVCWIVGSFTYYSLFKSDRYTSLYDLGSDDNLHIIAVALIPPILVGPAIQVYRRYVR